MKYHGICAEVPNYVKTLLRDDIELYLEDVCKKIARIYIPERLFNKNIKKFAKK